MWNLLFNKRYLEYMVCQDIKKALPKLRTKKVISENGNIGWCWVCLSLWEETQPNLTVEQRPILRTQMFPLQVKQQC